MTTAPASSLLARAPAVYDPRNEQIVRDELAKRLRGAVFTGSMANTIQNTGTDSYQVAQTLAEWLDFNDTSSTTGDKTKFWFPNIYAAAATGRVYRFNRVFIGDATDSSADRISDADGDHPTTEDWLSEAIKVGTKSSSLSVLNPVGGIAVTGATTTADYRTWAAAASGGAGAISGFSLNDDTGAGNPIGVALFGLTLHYSGITGISEGAEITIANAGTVVTMTPAGSVVANATMALNLTAGWAGYTNNVSCALHMGSSVGGAAFRTGWVVDDDALDTSIGQGGAGVAASFADGQSLRWMTNASTTSAEVYGDTNGYNVKGAIVLTDTVTGTKYKVTIASGVLTLTAV